MDQLYSTLFEAVAYLQNGRHIDCESKLLSIQETLASAPCRCGSNICRNFVSLSIKDTGSSSMRDHCTPNSSELIPDPQSNNICHNCAIKETVHIELEKYMTICRAVRAREELIEADKLAVKCRYTQVHTPI